MTKGTPSMGKHSGKKTHIACRRCGTRTYHIRKKRCSSCGYGATSKVRGYTWQKKGSTVKLNKTKKSRKK